MEPQIPEPQNLRNLKLQIFDPPCPMTRMLKAGGEVLNRHVQVSIWHHLSYS